MGFIPTLRPSFESPAEIKALRILGADAVSVSTIRGDCCKTYGHEGSGDICHQWRGILDQPLTHEEVMETGKSVEKKFSSLVREIVGSWE